MKSLISPCLLAVVALTGAAYGADADLDSVSPGWPPADLRRPPHTPTLTAFTVPGGGVSLNWESVSTAEGFRILRSPNGKDFAPIGEVEGPRALSFTDTDAPPGRTLFYRLESYNAAGSALSNTAVVRFPAYNYAPPVAGDAPIDETLCRAIQREDKTSPDAPRGGFNDPEAVVQQTVTFFAPNKSR